MFRDVTGCSGMFRNVPGCSMFAVRQTQTAAWQVKRVNIDMKCFNRYPILKLDFHF